MRKRIFVVCVSVLLALLSIASDAKVTMFAKDGRTVSIEENAVEDYKKVGWYTSPVIEMYAPDGRTVVVAKTAVEEYESVGWYTHPVIKMYAPDGRTVVVAKTAVEEYKSVGWYTQPVVKMYAPDGRTVVVAKTAMEEYESVGWYTHPVIKMYASDGRTIVVAKTAKEEYERVGWYTQPVAKVYSADGRTQIIAKSALIDFRRVGWYPEPPVFPSSVSVTDFTLYRGQKDVKPHINFAGSSVNVLDYSLTSSDTSVVTTQNGLYDGKSLYATVTAPHPFKTGTATLMAVTADGKTDVCRVTVKDMEFYDFGTKHQLPDFGYYSGFKTVNEDVLPQENDGFVYRYENWSTVESYMDLLEGYGWKYCAVESETEYDYYIFSDEQQSQYVVICDFWQYDTVVIFAA